MFGFKSFAEKTVLTFDEGITGVVGPNGCGKSNIADAFRWVLGEQSAKSMRGHKMNDVIFAGSTHRKPLEYAEVTIVLGDIGGRLPVVFDEIAVTRRLYRNGESEYLLNNHTVRLKDIQSLFMDTGIGKSAFSVFEQGKIDQIIQLSPLDRRHIFEEAAGILRFLQRKREALRKLEQTDQNLTRVKDIHQEVEKQIAILERQAEQAKWYKENKANLENLEKGLLAAKWQVIQAKKQEAGNKDKDIEQQIIAFKQSIERHYLLSQESKLLLGQDEKALRLKHEEGFRKRSEKDVWSREHHLTQERLKEARTQEKKWMMEIENLLIKRQERKHEQQTSSKRQKDVSTELAEQAVILQEVKEKTHGLELHVAQLREAQQQAHQERLSVVHLENQVESDLKQNSLKLEHLQERQNILHERKETIETSLSALTEDVEVKEKAVQEFSQSVDDQKVLFAEVEDTLQELTQDIQTNQLELDLFKKDLLEQKTRQKVLMKLRDDMEGFSMGSKRLLQESNNAKSPLYKKLRGLYELISPNEKQSEKAVAAALRPYAQTLVVENDHDFKLVWEYAQSLQLKDYSLLCLERIGTKVLEHFTGSIHFVDKSKSLLEWLQMDHSGEIWTEDGIWIDRRRVVFDAHQAENSVFLREAELKTLEHKIIELEKGLQIREMNIQELINRRAVQQAKKLEIDKIIRRSEMKLVEANFSLQRSQSDWQKASGDEKQIKNELQTIKASIETILVALQDLQRRHADVKAKSMQVQSDAQALNSQLEAQAAELKAQRAQLFEVESKYRQVEEEQRKLQHVMHVSDVKDSESMQQEERLRDDIETNRERQKDFKQREEECVDKLEVVEEDLAAILQLTHAVEEEIDQKKRHLLNQESEVKKQEAQLKQQETAAHQVNILMTQLNSAQQGIEKELQERHNLSVEKASGYQIVQSIEQTEKQIKFIRQELEQAGDINMTSIEEYNQCKTRHQYLDHQMGDLNMSKEEVLQIVAQLDIESRKIFKETFEVIRQNFRKNFQILFSGGEADLQFTDAEDILEAGIEISAKPPGKQMRSISLLSGGEKCLTALALLFAIFEVKPAPFCILDEIDAPLDDANVDRFVNIVKEFIDRCQFIIITHNKRTMSIADVLFGVSMQERGVSKLLSLELAEEAVG